MEKYLNGEVWVWICGLGLEFMKESFGIRELKNNL